MKAFRQDVCGFDILRTKVGSVLCDVNGWSFFVKGNLMCYKDCSSLLQKYFLEKCSIPFDPLFAMAPAPDGEVSSDTYADYENLEAEQEEKERL